MKTVSYAKWVGGIIALWFAWSIVASALHLFVTSPGLPPIPIGLGFSVPVLVFLGWFAVSKGFREFVLDLDPRALTLVQTFRVVGFTFLVLYSYHILPGMFALPAGWGDIFIGATAPLAAWGLARPDRRGGFIFWQILGIADLVDAVALGAMASVLRAGAGDFPMAVLPLSLIPVFAVPLLLILHVICIAQAWRWKKVHAVAHGPQVATFSVGPK